MTKYFLYFILTLPNVLFSQTSLWENKSFEKDGNILNYRWLTPRSDTSGSFPLVIFLHGAGERGTDNDKQLLHGTSLFSNDSNRKTFPAYVLAPQCPTQYRWVETDWSLKSHDFPSKPSVPMQLLLDLLEQLLSKNLSIDKSRIYVTGLSMGGFGTYDLISRMPDMIAAAAPVCGGADFKEAYKIKNIPLWMFHGDKDMVVPTSRTEQMAQALQAVGAKPKVSILKNTGHNAWTAAYQQELIQWMFEQKKTN